MVRNDILAQTAYATLLLLALSALTSIGAGTAALYLGLALTLVGLKSGFSRIEADPGLGKAIFFFLACILITSFFSYDPAFSLKRVAAVATRFVPVFVAAAWLKGPDRVRGMVVALAVSTLAADGYAFWQWSQGMTRVYAFANHPIVFAALLIEAVPLLLVAAYSGIWGGKTRAALLAVAGISTAALIMTGTRGAWLAAIGMILAYIALNLRKNVKLAITAALLIVVVLTAAATVVPAAKERLLTGLDVGHASNSERLLMWQSAWEMFGDHPFTGVGLGMYSGVEKTQYLSPEAKNPDVHMHAHNTYLNFLAETGLVGFAGFIYLFGYILYSNYRRFAKNPADIWSLGMMLITVGFLVQGFTEYNFGHLLVLRLLTLLAGICLAGTAFCKPSG